MNVAAVRAARAAQGLVGGDLLAAVPNLVVDSYDVNAWTTKSGITAALDATGPTGPASTVTDSSDGGPINHYAAVGAGTPEVAGYEMVVVIRNLAAGIGWIRVLAQSGGSYSGYYFDTINGVAGSKLEATWTADTPIVEDWGGGWFACRCFVDVTALAAEVQLLFTIGDTGSVYTGAADDVCEVAHVGLYKGKSHHQLQRTT